MLTGSLLNSELATELRLAFDDDRDAETFLLRLDRHGPELVHHLGAVYGPLAPALLDGLIESLLHATHARLPDLRRLDETRLLRPDHWQRPDQLGYAAPAHRLGGILADVRGHAAYLHQLGVTYLHLHGVLGHEGGQAGDHRAVHPALGTLDDLSALARDLRAQGISLGVDVTLDCIPAAHAWAAQAAQGNARRQAMLTGDAAGDGTQALNWGTAAVFRETLDALLDLANRGVEVLNLRGWQHLHTPRPDDRPALLHALRSALLVVAPALSIRLDAPDPGYAALGTRDHSGLLSDLLDFPVLTGPVWVALHGHDTSALAAALNAVPPRPARLTWLPRLRDQDGRTAADLTGLHAAATRGDDQDTDRALRRLNLLHALILGFGGVPLLSMGDEMALTEAHMDWTQAEAARDDILTPSGRAYAWTQRMVQARAATPHLHAGAGTRAAPSPDARVLLLRRDTPHGPMLGVYNFSPDRIPLNPATLREHLGDRAEDRLNGGTLGFTRPVNLDPYAALWLTQP
ncbi:alpha-amylase family glycosyl hydrolase [Deinococcus ficus]|uniref:alpha-amylase family glycosyl hydrolase n=1 Tax=Deinococcus ficus TaxID=317577 RepID=UPI00040507C2|nr:alpha-amylase family glycosyl hydrolase [Deinococcus ficus]